MALAVALDDVKANQSRLVGDPHKGTVGGGTSTNFFGPRSDPGIPHAVLLQFEPGRVSYAHYHGVDQFQVLIEGKGKMGHHDLAPYSVHFSRANTPYGPFISDADTGLTCFNLHANTEPDWRSHHLPQEADKLKQVPDRKPWQITSQAAFPAIQSGVATADTTLQAIPGIEDAYGLAGYTLSMKPNAKAQAPDPAHGVGQYLAVLNGSVLHNDKELKAPALVFIYPNEGSYRVHAGPAGLEALVLNFPRPQSRPKGAARSVQASTAFKTWQCALCSFVYDEAAGIPEEGIPPGTRWQDVPETWGCPDCSASKSDFQMSELEH